MGWRMTMGTRRDGSSGHGGVTAGALVLPFILFSPLADRLTVVFPSPSRSPGSAEL